MPLELHPWDAKCVICRTTGVRRFPTAKSRCAFGAGGSGSAVLTPYFSLAWRQVTRCMSEAGGYVRAASKAGKGPRTCIIDAITEFGPVPGARVFLPELPHVAGVVLLDNATYHRST